MTSLRSEKEIISNWRGDISQPIVSICCVFYCHESYVEDALKGFLSQETDFPFEILINDDASTDGTADIIREYEIKYPGLIKPIYQTENQYSKGLKINHTYNFPRAKGRYIAMCDGDDYWTSNVKLQTQFEILEKNKKYMISTHLTDNIKKHKLLMKSEYTLDDVIRNFSPCHTSSYFFRNVVFFFNKDNLPKYMYSGMSGDYILACYLTGLGHMHVHKEFMSVYRPNKEGIWARHVGRQGEIYKSRHVLSIRDSIKFYFGYENLMYLSKKNLRLELGISRALFLNGEFVASFKGLIKAIVRLIEILGIMCTYTAKPPPLLK